MHRIWLVAFVTACATSEPTEQRGVEDPEGKADVAAGTCEGACGGQSNGSCYCDDKCAGFHDCCGDAAPVCGVESNRLENRATGPSLGAQVDVFAALPYPPGNVATVGNRVFISFFPDGNKGDFKIAEIVNGTAVAFPANASFQSSLNAVLGIRADNRGRLWLLDHGTIGLNTPRLVAIDVATQAVVLDYKFSSSQAGLGSLLNDLVIDGDWIYISDLSPVAKRPAIVTIDLRGPTPIVKRRLEKHPSVVNGKYDTYVDGREMKIKGIRPTNGIDGIALSAGYFYYAALNGGTLYRVPTSALQTASDSALAANVSAVAPITQTDGMIADAQGRIYVTDMEHYTLARVNTDGSLQVVARDQRLRWPDGLAWGADGALYLTCSALHVFMPKLIVTASDIAAKAPYHVFRITGL